MSANSEDFVNYILEQLEPLYGLTSGPFFGGTGLKCEAIQFAMIMENTLYFVVDGTNRPNYEEKGMGCFQYDTKKKRVSVKKYYEVPSDIMEEQDALIKWARDSILIARKMKKK